MKKDPRLAGDRLISGKLREKAGRSGATHTIVTVDGIGYAWSYRFTLTVAAGDDTPSDARVVQFLARAIRSAMEAGWDPESRGRVFRHEIAKPYARASGDSPRGIMYTHADQSECRA